MGRIIMEELVYAIFEPVSIARFQSVIQTFKDGARDAVILGLYRASSHHRRREPGVADARLDAPPGAGRPSPCHRLTLSQRSEAPCPSTSITF
jgi:hypothetical protein